MPFKFKVVDLGHFTAWLIRLVRSSHQTGTGKVEKNWPFLLTHDTTCFQLSNRKSWITEETKYHSTSPTKNKNKLHKVV